MQIDLPVKAQQLLASLANSIHDRDPKNLKPFYFTIAEVHIVEKFLINFVEEIKKGMSD